MRVKLVSYNVKCFPWTSPPIRDMVQWMTQRSGATIVALQEVWCRQGTWAAAFAAHGWSFVRPARESHITGIFSSGLAIAWLNTSWRLTEARFYPYISAIGLDSFVTKGWFRIELTDKKGHTLRLINTHMQSDYEVCDDLWRPIAEPVRMAQALQLADVEARMPPLPTLICGDMNTEMCWFSSCGWLTQHAGPSFSGTSQVLDHCAALNGAPWDLEAHRVCRECGDWSDHWPVWWTLQYSTQTLSPAGGGGPSASASSSLSSDS